MNHRSCVAVVSLGVLLAPALVCGQVTPPPPPASSNVAQPQGAKPGGKSAQAGRGAVDPLAVARRATAVSRITSLADEARGFHDGTLRARVQAQAADALWEFDRERALALFRRAWDAATQFDQEKARSAAREGAGERSMKRRASIFGATTNMRGEIVTTVARRDRTLGEKLLKESQSEEAQAAPDEAPLNPLLNDSLYADDEHLQRMVLARRLLDAGDTATALQTAGPGLSRLNAQTIFFLNALRARDARTADTHFASLLAGALGNPAADANHVSLLASYAFTPNFFVSVNRTGAVSTSMQGDADPAPDLAPALRADFFRVAALILLRPPAQPDQDRSTSGLAGAYFIITRLLPLFEQHAPAALPHLRARLAALAPDAPARIRDGRDERLTQGMPSAATTPSSPAFNALEDALDQAERATDAAGRDRAYSNAAIAALSKGDARAREFGEKINDGDLRRRVLAYIDFSNAQGAVERKQTEELIRLARNADFTPLQRVWAFAEAARLLAEDEPTRALEMLDEATAAARRIDGGTPDYANALVAIATRFFPVAPPRAWEMLAEAVKVANGTDKFNGRGGNIDVMLRAPGHTIGGGAYLTGSELRGVLALLARADFERAAALAGSFNGEAPRSVATLAVAVAVLNDKSKPKP